MKSKDYQYGWTWWWGDVDIGIHTRQVTDLKRYWNFVYRQLDSNGFDWRIFSVASLGFLASSYSLFATNTIWLALAYVYPRYNSSGVNTGEIIDQVTLAGILIGMILFGHLADRVGRKALYGLELIIITFATIGIIFSSEGYMAPVSSASSAGDYTYRSTMDILTAVVTWRFLLGIGIGAEYPMSAIIAAEFVSTETRGTMIASVFLMQSVGRIFAFVFGLAFLMGRHLEQDGNDIDMKLAIDATWRFVAGFGGIFAVMAIGLRLTIPESPRYHPKLAKILRDAVAPKAQEITASDVPGNGANAVPMEEAENQHIQVPSTPWFLAARRYLVGQRGWIRLATMCLLWFLLDVCFYGTGLDSPSTLNVLWVDATPPTSASNSSLPAPPPYEVDPSNTTETIDLILHNNAVRTLEVSCISSLVGSIAVIPLINYVSRKKLLSCTSLVLFFLFVITGALIMSEYAKPGDQASLVFSAFTQFMFNLGPNTVIFILAAEIWPTPFRGTFYGLAAASGKIGAMFVRHFVQMSISKVTSGGNSKPLGAMFIIFGGIMLAVAAIAWFEPIFPDVQDLASIEGAARVCTQRLQNKSLEQIAPEFQPRELAPTLPVVDTGERHRDLETAHRVEVEGHLLSGAKKN
ncbi:major facilitator superfamily domain-containing protein [Xylariales sp. PMI_506]|nr:major facilitator superfamily domain-containing protein [Xylariales sp. PMI_506]